MGWLIQLMLIIIGTRAVGHVFGLADVWFSQIDGNEQQDFTKGDQDDR